MSTPATTTAPASDTARWRLLSVKGDPFLVAHWERVVFLHFLIGPKSLRSLAPAPFELELYEGQACVTLVALTMRRFRPYRRGSLLAWFLRPITRQCFLNVRTYVRWDDEPGALFLWGWLSKPFGVELPMERFGLPCGFCSMEYDHKHETGTLHGVVNERASAGTFAYRATLENDGQFYPCAPGSLAEFAMERYTGFFCRCNRPFVFRAWHPRWLQAPADVIIDDDSLLAGKFPWFKEARLAAANFAPGFEDVSLGRVHRLEEGNFRTRTRRSVLSAFYEMP